MLGHTLSLNANNFTYGLQNTKNTHTWFGNTTLSNFNNVLIEVFDGLSPSQQSLLQGDTHLHAKIVALTSKQRMRKLLKHNNDIARIEVGMLIALILKGDLLVVIHTPLNGHGQRVIFLDQLVTLALGTHMIKDRASTSTLRALLLHLGHESGSELTTNHLDASSAANGTLVDMIGIISARTTTSLANNIAANGDLDLSAVVEVLKADSQLDLGVLVALALSETEGMSEDAAEGVEAAASLLLLLLALLEAGLTLVIVDSSLVLIGENVVGFLNIDELGLAFFGLALVGVVLEAQLSVGTLDFAFIGITKRMIEE